MKNIYVHKERDIVNDIKYKEVIPFLGGLN